MKSKDQIKLENIYSNLLQEQEDEHLEADYESRSDVDFQDDDNVDPLTKEDDEEENEELDTPIEKKADAMLSQGAPQDGMSDQQVKVIEDLLDEKN
jgi:hypothetical protein